MAFESTLSREKFRRIFLVFFAVSSLLPALIVVFLVYQYVVPLLDACQVEDLTVAFTLGGSAMVLIPLLGFFMVSQRIGTLEQVVQEMEKQSARVTGETPAGESKNEILSLVHSFESLLHATEDNLEQRKRLKELISNLIAVASDLTSELDFDRLFPLVIGRVSESMAAERTSLYVIDWEKNELWTKVAQRVRQIRLPIGQGIAGRVAMTGEPINVADAWELPYFSRAFDIQNRFRTRSVLCMPIRNRTGESIGVLQVINKQDKDRFDEEDEVLFRCLTAQVGIALENSLLLEELMLSFQSAMSTLSAMVDARHPLTAGHSHRVMEYALLIAEEMGLGDQEREVLRFAGLLHDIGKIGIRDHVLFKNGPFTPEERSEMNSHTVKTRNILTNFRFPRALRGVTDTAVHHHEKLDGRGYPDGLAGDRIPLGSKILAVADVFDALTSRREYPKYGPGEFMSREPMPLSKVISVMEKDSGSHFDPGVVQAFLRCLPRALLLFRGDHFSPEYVDGIIRMMAPKLLEQNESSRPLGNLKLETRNR